MADRAKMLFWMTCCVPAVVEHQAAAERVVDQVVLDQVVAARGVEVDAPAERRVRVGPDVVEDVVADHAARRDAQAVDQARVAEHAVAEVVDVVELDHVVVRAVRGVVPVPADADAGVEQVVDVVVRDAVVAALGDPDADARRIDAAAVEDVVVVDEDAARFGGVGRGHVGLADADAAGAQVEQPVPLDAAVLAAAAEPDAVGADVGDLAALDRAVPGAVGHHRGGHFDRRLRAAVALRRRAPSRHGGTPGRAA